MLRFSLANACTEIFPTDFTAVTALVNGNVSSYLFIEPAGMPPFEIQQPQPYCSGNEIIFNYPYTSLNGRQILFYSWDFGNGQLSSIQSDTTVYATEGDYPVTLSVTTVDGCIYSQQHVIPVYPTPVAAFTSSYDAPSNVVSFTNESSISSGSINIYLWNFGTSTSNLQSPNYTFPAMGFYDVTLTATSDLGCTSSITQLVSATDNIAEVSLRTLNLFPNPTSNFIQIESSFHTNVRITDAVGWILTENYILQTNQVKTIDVSLFPSGVYFLECVETENMLRKRFVIQK
jgi:PKD repeat protein